MYWYTTGQAGIFIHWGAGRQWEEEKINSGIPNDLSGVIERPAYQFHQQAFIEHLLWPASTFVAGNGTVSVTMG